jgi:hypothetical protein
MKPNPNLDELLSRFMDGELSPRQRTEVQRMAAHDPQVARRLRQLQNTRSLFCSLPVAKAPSDLLEQIKVSLERHTLLQEQPMRGRRSAGVWHLALRRLVSAAAVLVLMGVLGVVVYQIVSPVPPGEAGSQVAKEPVRSVPVRAYPEMPDAVTAGGPVLAADEGFTGQLELRTARLVQMDTFVARAVENSGLSGRIEPDIMVGNQRVYRIVGSRESVNRLVVALSGQWRNFDSAALRVDRPEGAGAPVIVEAITPDQTAGIVTQNSTTASLNAAAAYAVMNRMARNMPGSDLRPLIQYEPGSLLAALDIPKPKETGPDTSTPTTQAPSEGKAQVSLTIVLRSTM